MKILKYILLTFTVIIVATYFYVKLTLPESILMAGNVVSLEKPWIEFSETDDSNIGNLIRAYRFEEGERSFKKNIGQNEFLIACLKKDKSWNYYYYYRGSETYEMMLISEDLEKDISPPF